MTYYTDIDTMPIFNWRKINETNDLRFLLVKWKNILKKDKKRMANVFYKMRDEFIDAFPNEDLVKVYELKFKIEVLRITMALDGNRFHNNFIRMHQAEIDDINKKYSYSDRQTFAEIKVYVEKFMGFRLNEKEVTVTEYYNYLKALNNKK